MCVSLGHHRSFKWLGNRALELEHEGHEVRQAHLVAVAAAAAVTAALDNIRHNSHAVQHI